MSNDNEAYQTGCWMIVMQRWMIEFAFKDRSPGEGGRNGTARQIMKGERKPDRPKVS